MPSLRQEKPPALGRGLAVILSSAMIFGAVCCSRKPAPPAARAANLDSLVSEYLNLAAALGERDPDALDFYFGPETLAASVPAHPPAVGAIRVQALALRDSLAVLPSPSPRTRSLMAQTDALALRAQLLEGHNLGFDAEARTFFDLDSASFTSADSEAADRARSRRQIAALIPASATLAHAYTVYDARFLVPSARVPAVLEEALAQCRAETLRHINLPANEHVDVEYVSNRPWSAFSRYLGDAHSRISINLDHPLTVDRILNLACHEAYPGHHTFNTLRDVSLIRQAHPPQAEFYAQLTFSPQSLVSEAAASYAPDVAFPPDVRLHIERDILFPLAGPGLKSSEAARYLQVSALVASLWTAQPGIARDYLDGRLEFVRAADALERETLMEHAEYLLLYLNQYRTYMLTYTVGRDMIRARIEAPVGAGRPTSDERWRRYRELATEPVTSLGRDAR